MNADPVRRLALDTLVRVGQGQPLEPLLDAALSRVPEARGRAFLAELIKGTLRRQGCYDFLIQRHSRRRRARRPAGVQELLRLSLHQILACEGVPAYAAVHQAAELAREAVSPRLVPYVNAVLQAVVRATSARPDTPPLEALRPLFPDRERDTAAFLAAWHSHPRWLVERWLARWGLESCEALCAHDNRPAPITFHVLTPVDPTALAARLSAAGHPVVQGRRHPRALIMEKGPERAALRELLAAEPALIVQDEGAQEAVAWLAGGAGGRLLDLCAAPGGKTFHLRALWPEPEAIVAMDRSRTRLALMVETSKRIAGAPLPMLLADGESPPLRAGSFDTVLLDGPCSGSGVLRHHPEGRWRLGSARLRESGERLRRLARAAAQLLAPGGRLLYMTCSLEPEENDDVVAALMADDDSDLVPDPHPDPSQEGSWSRVWRPQETGTDGFYAARLRRR